MQHIGLHGKAGVGKDTIADFLVSNYGFIKYSFSDALYREVSAAFGVPEEELKNREQKERPHPLLVLSRCLDDDFAVLAAGQLLKERAARGEGVFWDATKALLTPRWVLQVWGTNYRRKSNPDYWLERADVFLRAFLETLEVREGDTVVEYKDHPGLVNTSVRFPNEREWIYSTGGVVWHVSRPVSTATGVSALHLSETPLPLRTGDKLILNNSTIARLHTGVSLALAGNDIVNTEE